MPAHDGTLGIVACRSAPVPAEVRSPRPTTVARPSRVGRQHRDNDLRRTGLSATRKDNGFAYGLGMVVEGEPPAPLPGDLPILERSAVRVVVLDVEDRVLLLHVRDRDHPDLGTWWELPGGGIDPGETYVEAAVRELREEAGIVADGARLGPPNWRRRASFRSRGRRHLQDEVVVALRLPVPGPDVDESQRLDYEREDYFDFRWWPLPELRDSGARFYPGRLPVLLDPFLGGEEIDEPFELFS